MMSTKEACPGAATLEQAMETLDTSRMTTVSTENDIIPAAGGQAFRVADFLPRGRENAVPSRYLANAMGFRSVRELQKAVARERNAGAVILSTCTDGGGYYLSDDPREIRAFIHTLFARARNTECAIESARLELQRIEGDSP